MIRTRKTDFCCDNGARMPPAFVFFHYFLHKTLHNSLTITLAGVVLRRAGREIEGREQECTRAIALAAPCSSHLLAHAGRAQRVPAAEKFTTQPPSHARSAAIKK